ncbi:hypothetical protein [Mycobacterium sp. 852002-51613_SCH5001154]|uniref:hypothetical protein n=1 Tax=Mycobacterium sp. 852002-51613_SCH5001154 TaxID=1834104 RepID=UPI0012E70A23|nr:hypothetical protein [Mycobacterium sp. 852002-51613_SCH5001154]
MDLANVVISGISAFVAVASAIAAAVSAVRSREAKRIAEEKRDEAVGAAIKAASATDRIAAVQESRLTVEDSAQAFSVVIVPAPIKGGRSGWHVLNDSDQPVTRVAVSSATGAKIQVYNNDLTQFEKYVEHTLAGHSHSQLRFRPTDADGARTDPAEVERMVLRFTDARNQTWERVGAQAPRLIDP